jgi:undecaprenyl-diphosphatase
MTEILLAILLGIVEGLTEFLPVSSTGHLILANRFLGIDEHDTFWKAFDIIVQGGAILSVVFYFWKRIFPFAPGLDRPQQQVIWLRWGKTLLAFVPAAVLGVLFDDLIEEYLLFPVPVSVALIVGGILLLVLENRQHKGQIASIEEMPWLTALLIGLIQCLAMVPGTSRSAATIIGGLLLGTNRYTAAEFSFFLAMPTIMGASVFKTYKLLKSGLVLDTVQWTALGVGFLVSFVSAWLVIAVFMRFIQHNNFSSFGWYRIALGALVLALVGLGLL